MNLCFAVTCRRRAAPTARSGVWTFAGAKTCSARSKIFIVIGLKISSSSVERHLIGILSLKGMGPRLALMSRSVLASLQTRSIWERSQGSAMLHPSYGLRALSPLRGRDPSKMRPLFVLFGSVRARHTAPWPNEPSFRAIIASQFQRTPIF
jgi:hypothetical protein